MTNNKAADQARGKIVKFIFVVNHKGIQTAKSWPKILHSELLWCERLKKAQHLENETQIRSLDSVATLFIWGFISGHSCQAQALCHADRLGKGEQSLISIY